MAVPRPEQIVVRRRRPHFVGDRLWREWCFVRVVFSHVWVRLLILIVILFGGGLAFFKLDRPTDGEEGRTIGQCIYLSYCLVFGESLGADEFPESLILESLCYVLPLIGLAVIIEGVVDFSLMLRDRRRCERSWCTMLAKSFNNHIVLVGLGRLGFKTWKLLRQLGEDVVVIERDDTGPFVEEIRRGGSALLIGDARYDQVLEDANVAKAKSIVLATSDDLANLEAALDARRVNPDIRVVLRMFDQNMADKVGEGFNIRLAMSQSAVAAPTFATAAIEPSIVASYVVGERLIVMQPWLVRDSGPLSGKDVGEVMRTFGVGVVERRPLRGESVPFPPPETILERGDRVIVQGTFEHLSRLQAVALTPSAENPQD